MLDIDESFEAIDEKGASRLVSANLWNGAEDDLCVWALLDGQWIPDLVPRLLKSELEFCSLFEGPLTQNRILSSPYLVKLEREHSITKWLLKDGWGRGWGVFFQASSMRAAELYPHVTAEHLTRRNARGEFFCSEGLVCAEDATALRLRRHFRRFTQVELEADGRFVAFRFFDPAVLRTYLFGCAPAEIESFFGPVRFFLMESFSEAERLRQPEKMLLVSRKTMWTDGIGQGKAETMLSAKTLDLRSSELQSIKHSPAADFNLRAQNGSHVLIRSPQMAAFQREATDISIEELIDDLARKYPDRGYETEFFRAVVCDQIALSRRYEVPFKNVTFALSCCRLSLGPNYMSQSSVRTAISNASNYDQYQIFEILMELADDRDRETAGTLPVARMASKNSVLS